MIDYVKVFGCVEHNKLWEILQETGIPDHLTCLLRNLYAGQAATVKTGHGQQTGSKSGKEYVKAVHCHLAYLTYKFRVHHVKCQTRWSTNWNKDCKEKYQQPQICRWYHSNDKKWRGANEPLDEAESGEWKASLELIFKKLRSWQIGREKLEVVTDFLFLVFKITTDCDCSHEIQRCLLLERKAITNQSIRKQRDHFVNKSP